MYLQNESVSDSLGLAAPLGLAENRGMTGHNNRWYLLGFLALAQFMVVLDVSIMNVALPSVQKSLNFDTNMLQWIVTAYTLAFGGFLLFGGRAADLYGRRNVFIAGVSGFALASLLVGFAQSDVQMIVLRGLQGLAAAFMSPAALSIILVTFHEGSERTRALSIWGAVAAGGGAIGVLLGGILTQYLSWRWNFFVNVPVGLLVAYFAYQFAPAHESEETSKSLDLPGAAIVTSGLIAFVYCLSQVATKGWDSPEVLGLFALSGALLVGFIFNESRVSNPLVPLSIFKVGNIAAANLTQLPITASLFSMFFFVSLYVQNVLGFSPVESGLSFLPVPAVVGVSASLAPLVMRRFGYKPILVIAPLLLAAGLFILAAVPVEGTYVNDVLPALLLLAVGLGFCFVSTTVAATSGAPGHFSGLASGLLNTSQQIGGALGLAILSAVAASKTAEVFSAGPLAPSLGMEALVAGFHSAFYAGIVFAFCASLFALFFIRSVSDTPHALLQRPR